MIIQPSKVNLILKALNVFKFYSLIYIFSIRTEEYKGIAKDKTAP